MGQTEGSSHFTLSEQCWCLLKTNYFRVDKQNKYCGSVQKLYHLTSCVCDPRHAPSLDEVHCTGQAKCVSIEHERADWIQRQVSTRGPLAHCLMWPRSENMSCSVNICEELMYSFYSCTTLWDVLYGAVTQFNSNIGPKCLYQLGIDVWKHSADIEASWWSYRRMVIRLHHLGTVECLFHCKSSIDISVYIKVMNTKW